MKLIYIILFGVLGVLARYYVGFRVIKHFSHPFPFGTFLINLSGAFLIGIIYVMAAERSFISTDMRLGIIVGFLGGYTTFSSFCFEAVRLVEDSEYFYAALYLGASPILGFLAAFSGMFITRWLLRVA